MDTDAQNELPGLRLKVIGIGGAGNNAVDRIQMDRRLEVPLANINTDQKTLSASPLAEKLMIGRETTGGLSAGYDPAVGRAAAEESAEAIAAMVDELDLVFLVAGLGAGTGSGATPLVAQLAAERGAVVVAFVTLPFSREGARATRRAEEALKALREQCHAVIPLPNDLLLQEIEETATLLDAFQLADEWICRGIGSIWSMLFREGLMNVDFATLRSAFAERGGKTVFGLARGAGEDPVAEAKRELELCPLLHLPENRYIRQTDSLIVHVQGGPELTMKQVNEIIDFVVERFGSKEQTVLGAVIDGQMAGKIEITVIGTASLEGGRARLRRLTPAATPRPMPRVVPKKESIERVAPPASAAVESALEAVADGEDVIAFPPPPSQPVESKAGFAAPVSSDPRPASPRGQEEFAFPGAQENRGHFDRTDENLYEGADLDVPTYLRRGLKIALH